LDASEGWNSAPILQGKPTGPMSVDRARHQDLIRIVDQGLNVTGSSVTGERNRVLDVFRGFRARVNVQRRADGSQTPRLEHHFDGALLVAVQREAQLRHQGSVTVDDLEIVEFALFEAHLDEEGAAARVDDGELALDATRFAASEIDRVPTRFDDGAAADGFHRCG